MSLVGEVVSNILDLHAGIRALWRETRRQGEAIRRNEQIALNLRHQAGAERLRSLEMISPMMVRLISGSGSPFWNAERMEWDENASKWIVDDEDTLPYTILPTPGACCFFAACRALVVRHHNQNADSKSVYVPIGGECFGFRARITGAPEVRSSKQLWYPWEQVGLGTDDTYKSGSAPAGFDNFDKALLVSSLSHDESLTERHDLVTDSGIFIQYNPYSNRFEFDSSMDPVFDEDCP